MTELLIVRRRRLGHSTTAALSGLFTDMGITSVVWRADRRFPERLLNASTQDATGPTVLRWGCTASMPPSFTTQVGITLNNARGIHRVCNKTGFLGTLKEVMDDQTGMLSVLTLPVMRNIDEQWRDSTQKWVVRPARHAQGRNLQVVTQDNLYTALTRMNRLGGQSYARPLIQKKAEYRAYVLNGRVVNLARKTPSNPDDVAWNVAQGGRFDNVRWDDWPDAVVDLACRVHRHTGLTMSGIDVMVDEDDTAWFIEANAAPSLPLMKMGVQPTVTSVWLRVCTTPSRRTMRCLM